jgi:hypothetical protein
MTLVFLAMILLVIYASNIPIGDILTVMGYIQEIVITVKFNEKLGNRLMGRRSIAM